MGRAHTGSTRMTTFVRRAGEFAAHSAVMSKWNATVLGPSNSVHQNRIYSLRVFCGDSYPEVPPEVWFITKINLPCVQPTDGKVRRRRESRSRQVNPALFPVLGRWQRGYTLEKVLVELRRCVAAATRR